MRALLFAALLVINAATALAQERMLQFDVASLRENKTGAPPAGDQEDSNVPLGPGNVYSPTGGQLNLRNVSLVQMVVFAYRMTGSQQSTFVEMAPQWVRDARYDLQARTEKTDVAKDELRLMMRSLLANRFALKVHYEDRSMPVFSMQLAKAGVTGPHFQRHTGEGCAKVFRKDDAVGAGSTPEGYPVVCGGLLLLGGSPTTHFRIGARDMPIGVFSTSMTSWGDLGRPVVNDTGIDGNIDFVLDFVPPQAEASAEADGDGFREAVRKQLGIKLESQKRAVPVLLLDAISRPTEN